MNEPRSFPFGGVPVYNPQSLSKEEAIAQFHARQTVYEGLIDLLKDESPSHVLIIGTRGMGKTTLLQRLRIGVEDSPELSQRYVPLTFPEEQYNVNHLHHFLLNTVDALADALEQRGDRRMLALVEGEAHKLNRASPQEVEEGAPRLLAEMCIKLNRNLLLLVDNADRLFETIDEKEQWRLRDLLSRRHELTFFGATTQASEGIYGPERAFYEFFRIQQLAPLTVAEVENLLRRLAESVQGTESGEGSVKNRIEIWLTADRGRLRTLVQLTGGNPRTAVLLLHLALDGLEGGAREYLEQLLDQSTPSYKGRVDDLPPQAQQVLDGVALRWDPVMASEIAEVNGLETGTVSTHLTRLVRQGILEKVDAGDNKRALYQVAERFFNIWYLMRASRRVRAKLRWFVEFLRVFYESGELEQTAWRRMEFFRGAGRVGQREIESLFAYASASGVDSKKFEEFLWRECADREELWGPFFASEAVRNIRGEASSLLGDPALHDFLEIVKEFNNTAEDSVRNVLRIEPGNSTAYALLIIMLWRRSDRKSDALDAFTRYLELVPGNADMWSLLGLFLACQTSDPVSAEKAFRRALELKPHTAVMRNLGVLLFCQLDKQSEGIELIRAASRPDSDDDVPAPVSRAILAACLRVAGGDASSVALPLAGIRDTAFWQKLCDLCQTYAPFGKILRGLCDLVEEMDRSNPYVPLSRAVAIAQLNDFPRAVVAFQDALVGDPVDLLTWGSPAVDTVLSAAVRNGRVRDCLEVIEKKGWFDAWRPICEALKAVEARSAEYLKRVAVEIQEPAKGIIRRIAPELPGQAAPRGW